MKGKTIGGSRSNGDESVLSAGIEVTRDECCTIVDVVRVLSPSIIDDSPLERKLDVVEEAVLSAAGEGA
ncbi:MAG TPA: hypothetical protein VEK15_03850 [Vicinamibacteria bacterium]|nr:hypothetical protein [Vicinamibacteria bacterium]